jgi:hypothetical protein
MPNNSLYRYGVAQKLPELHPIEAANGRIVSITTSSEGVVAVLDSSAPNTPSIRTEITLPADHKSVEFRYHLQKEATLRKEAAYIAFPLSGSKPEFRYETQNGIVDPSRDELVGGSREWYAVNHWASMSSDGVTTAILPEDAPLVAFGDIVRGSWPSEFRPQSAAIFSWIMSNYWDTNFSSSQGGEFDFHYTLVSAPTFSGANLTRTGWETATRLESDPVHAGASRGFAQNSLSFLAIDNPDDVLTTWKLAEDGDGSSILRLENVTGTAGTVLVSSPVLRIKRAWLCNALEDKRSEQPLSSDGIHVSVPAFGVVTLRMETEPQTSIAGGRS